MRDLLINILPAPTGYEHFQSKDLRNAVHHAILTAYCLRFFNCPQAWDKYNGSGSHPFTSYAAHSWFGHLKESSECYVSLIGLVHNFTDARNLNFRNWRIRYEEDCGPVPMVENTSAVYYASLFGLMPTLTSCVALQKKISMLSVDQPLPLCRQPAYAATKRPLLTSSGAKLISLCEVLYSTQPSMQQRTSAAITWSKLSSNARLLPTCQLHKAGKRRSCRSGQIAA